jgi:hypothetical protein
MTTRWCFIAMAICLAGVLSCKDEKDDEPTCSTAWGTELQAELNAVVAAGNTWANDPSEANCNNYKSKYQAYITALRPYGNCSALTGQNRTAFEEALDDAEESLVTLCD